MFYSILLAGGQSSRMGQDKGSLEIKGETLLQHAFKLLESIGSERILLSGAIKHHACIPDLLPRSGPLGGIYSSLAWLKNNAALDNSLLLLIPIDMPLLNAESLLRLIQQAEQAGEKCCHYEGEIFPCVIRASEDVYAYLKQAFSEGSGPGGKRSMKSLMKSLSPLAISPAGLPAQVFMNINRPADWQTFIALSEE